MSQTPREESEQLRASEQQEEACSGTRPQEGRRSSAVCAASFPKVGKLWNKVCKEEYGYDGQKKTTGGFANSVQSSSQKAKERI